jgi:conjugal transfer pilus assembly protein TrbC
VLREFQRPALPSAEQLQTVPRPVFPTDEVLRSRGFRHRAEHSLPKALHPGLPSPDINAIAEQFRALRPDRAALAQGELLIFISFSLPEATLRALVAQARRAGAVLVMRGLHQNSIKATLPRVRELLGSEQQQAALGWQIDPRLFRAFEVKVVPTFALTEPQALARSCTQDACMRPATWASVSGNVSLHAALDAMAQGAPALARNARHFSERLEVRR